MNKKTYHAEITSLRFKLAAQTRQLSACKRLNARLTKLISEILPLVKKMKGKS